MTTPADPSTPARLYTCPGCKAKCVRPTVDPQIPDVPFPKPCDRCGHALNRMPWTNTTFGAVAAAVIAQAGKANATADPEAVQGALAAARVLVATLQAKEAPPAAVLKAVGVLDQLLIRVGV